MKMIAWGLIMCTLVLLGHEQAAACSKIIGEISRQAIIQATSETINPSASYGLGF